MQKVYIVVIAVTLFLTSLFMMTTIRNYDDTLRQDKIGMRVLDLLSPDVPAIWQKKPDNETKVLSSIELDIQKENQFEGSGMTREELGRHGWAMLHMISATLPVDFDPQFVFKINVFLNLFGQFYPCKVCASHFLHTISNYPYEGSTREDFMQYMCVLHNKVNKKLDKPVYECAKVHDKWGGFCGCEEEFNKSVAKYKSHSDD